MMFFQLRLFWKLTKLAIRALLWLGVIGLIIASFVTKEKGFLAGAIALSILTAFLFSFRQPLDDEGNNLSSDVLSLAGELAKYSFAGFLCLPFLFLLAPLMADRSWWKVRGALIGFFRAFEPYYSAYLFALGLSFALWLTFSLASWWKSKEKFTFAMLVGWGFVFYALRHFAGVLDDIANIISQVAGLDIHWWHFITRGAELAREIPTALEGSPKYLRSNNEKFLLAQLAAAFASLSFALFVFTKRQFLKKVALLLVKPLDKRLRHYRQRRARAVR